MEKCYVLPHIYFLQKQWNAILKISGTFTRERNCLSSGRIQSLIRRNSADEFKVVTVLTPNTPNVVPACTFKKTGRYRDDGHYKG